MKKIYIAGTADTKWAELEWLRNHISADWPATILADVGTTPASHVCDVTNREIAAFHRDGADAVLACTDRGSAVTAMATAFEAFIASREDMAAIIGIGGGGGTAIITQAMRSLPLGIPKLMVSTLASGDVSAYVGVSDIIMMPSVSDLAGLNSISRVVLRNAAGAIAAMAATSRMPSENDTAKPSIGLTMFGVTTPCVTAIVGELDNEYDCITFHATGIGGRTMEKLADSNLLHGVIDITTTEVADLLVGGVLACTTDRFGAIARTAIPWVGSVGALDMVNFQGRQTVPERFSDRRFHIHNSNVTLMRTTAEECVEIGHWIGARLNDCHGEVRLLLPEKGISALDVEGGAFHDPEADTALFEALESTVRQTANRKVIRLPLHINDPEFAHEAALLFAQVCKK